MPTKSTSSDPQQVVMPHVLPKSNQPQWSSSWDDKHNSYVDASLKSFKRRRWPNRAIAVVQVREMMFDD